MTIFRASPLSRALVLWLVLGGAVGFGEVERRAVTVLGTADLHGRILPLDYADNAPANVGLAKLATLIRRARAQDPELLLLDGGDTIQGTPLAYYHARVNNAPEDPMMRVMNHLGYDALVPGNHEYNFGLEVLHKAREEANFPWLSANTVDLASGEPAFPPYVVKTVRGIRLGILGLTTPGIPGWENPEHYAGLEFRDPVVEAARWVPHLRETEAVDAVVVVAHFGLESNLGGGGRVSWPENGALRLVREVPGIDLVFLAHTHRRIPALVVEDVLLAQPGRWGDHLVRGRLYFERASPDAPWQLVGRESEALAVTDEIPADPAVLVMVEPYEAATQAWLDREIGHSPRRIEAADAYVRDNALVDLIHRVQLEAGEAEVSLAASFNRHAVIPAGPVTVRDITALYVYENTLYVVALTGAQLKAALEHSARFFRSFESGKTAEELIDPVIPGYNFDTAEGVEYTLDLRRPPGDRIVDLRFQGAPLEPDRVLRVAVNNYRRNGGGGYQMLSEAPVLWRTGAEIRNLIIEWLEANGTVPPEPTGNWRLER
jgi:2',3'-cyclic-nucleotide 2'-phosphodiesterase / 3'-nucleotidase